MIVFLYGDVGVVVCVGSCSMLFVNLEVCGRGVGMIENIMVFLGDVFVFLEVGCFLYFYCFKMGWLVVVSLIGIILEWYDFIVYNLMVVLVFNVIFFLLFDLLLGIILVFLIYVVGYLLCLFGGIVFGYFGDKFGWCFVLVVMFILMGVFMGFMGMLLMY